MTDTISDLRKKINKIDEEIILLILKRLSLVHKIGLKKSSIDTRIYVPEREVEIFKRLSAISNLSPKEIQSFYTHLISFCRKSEEIISVGILENCSSLLALKQIFGEFVNPSFSKDIGSLFYKEKELNYILVPFSNEMIEFLIDSKYHIINRTIAYKKVYFLLSKFPNEIQSEDDTVYTVTKNMVLESSTRLKNGLFFTATTLEILKKDFDSKVKILGFVPTI